MSVNEVKRWSPVEIINKIKRRTGYFKRRYLKAYPKVKDVVFIWIPKNGGTSMYQALKPHGMQYLDNEAAIRFYFPNKGMVSFGPLNYSYLRDAHIVDDTFHQSAFKFAIVRNPFERAVSSYFYFLKNNWIHPQMSFKDFTYNILKINFEEECASFNSYEGYLFPQFKYITFQNQLVPDYVAKLENIESDVEVIKQRLQIDFELPHLNRTEHNHYRQYYCGESTQNILNAYREDFQRFGYSTSL